ncbi:MAG: caspase family protein [Deltaproteobacteria bacterium]|nr:caspase family protein [Deltaproteobacteria bacterium]
MKRGMLIAICLLFSLEVLSGPARAERALFGLVIGSNLSVDRDVAALRYADDDAMQNARLLGQMGAEIALLVEPDAATRALFPDLETVTPSRAAVHSAMARLNEHMLAARQRGLEPVFYFFYSGHGNVENNQGYVNLHGEKWTRSDMLELLESSRASVNHVVIDACKSYFLVFDRGAGGHRRQVRDIQLLGEHSRLPPHTGLLLSTSSGADSHEWEAVQAGVFSHELRSALRGAADVDADDAVTYEEAAAFVWTANAAIANPRFRPAFFSHPPRSDSQSQVLLDLAGAKGDRLVVDAAQGHMYVEDGQGLRLVDFHSFGEHELVLHLPGARPLFVRRPGSVQEVELPAGSPHRLAALRSRRRPVSSRGAEHVAFGKLFSKPFGPEAIEAWRTRPPDLEQTAELPTDWTWMRRGIGISAAVLAITGGALTGLALDERAGVDAQTTGLERDRINERIGRYNTGAVVCYALAGTALATYLVWTLWPEEQVEVHLLPADGAQLGLSGRF